ncbi:hypothetical protein SSX86_007756 [Deinandra increscens subsp. villosa]|uniref:RRM domain-containing protein n=1 Tax=Deinandra increscens subsp. villosa TaxID=3103831 RepID=A0AAP0DIN4_9ASTR
METHERPSTSRGKSTPWEVSHSSGRAVLLDRQTSFEKFILPDNEKLISFVNEWIKYWKRTQLIKELEREIEQDEEEEKKRMEEEMLKRSKCKLLKEEEKKILRFDQESILHYYNPVKNNKMTPAATAAAPPTSNYTSGQFGDTTYTKVFVGGLAWETQKDTMKTYFEQFGEILEAVVITDKTTGRSKGYGFVTFREADSAMRACVDAAPVIDGRRANCNLASLGVQRSKPSTPNKLGMYVGSRSVQPLGSFNFTHSYYMFLQEFAFTTLNRGLKGGGRTIRVVGGYGGGYHNHNHKHHQVGVAGGMGTTAFTSATNFPHYAIHQGIPFAPTNLYGYSTYSPDYGYPTSYYNVYGGTNGQYPFYGANVGGAGGGMVTGAATGAATFYPYLNMVEGGHGSYATGQSYGVYPHHLYQYSPVNTSIGYPQHISTQISLAASPPLQPADTMTYDPSDFVSSSKPEKTHIQIASGGIMDVKKEGTIEMTPTLKLSNCLYVPSLSHKLLSISHVTKELNCTVLMHPNFCILQDIRTGVIIGRDTERKGLYYVDDVTQIGTVMLDHGSVDQEAWLWHRRPEHPSIGGQGETEYPDTLSWLQFASPSEELNHSTQDESHSTSTQPKEPINSATTSDNTPSNLISKVSNSSNTSNEHATISNHENLEITEKEIGESPSRHKEAVERYVLPPRINRGIPPKWFVLEKETRNSRYPIANIANGNLSKEAKAFLTSLYADEIPRTIEQDMRSKKWKEAMEN